jgi:hypothetical protein
MFKKSFQSDPNTSEWNFILVGGGKVKIEDTNNSLKITPIDNAFVQFDHPGATREKDGFEITYSTGLYFISPYTDLTIERLMENPLPYGISGYRTSAEYEKIVKQDLTKQVLFDNDLHIKGRAYDFCPDYLMALSESALTLTATGKTTFTTQLKNYGGFKEDQTNTFKPIPQALSFKSELPGGGTKVYLSDIFSVSVTDQEVKDYTNRLPFNPVFGY